MVKNAALNLAGVTIVETLTELYNKCLEEKKVVSSWMKVIVVLIHKKEIPLRFRTIDQYYLLCTKFSLTSSFNV